jgi:HK97 family phage prohead protease
MYGGPASGGWIEQLDRRAFDETLGEKPDLHLLINHEGMPLARTKSGTLDLSVDRKGLKVTARLDRSDPDVQRLEAKMRRGDMDEMSFAFRVKDQKWAATPEFKDDEYALRTITKVSLHKGDVSVVNFGANPTTHAEIKSISDALDMIRECDPAELAEVRSGKPGVIQEVVEVLTRNAKTVAEGKPETAEKKGMSVREALSRQGLASTDGSTLSLSEAIAQSE